MLLDQSWVSDDFYDGIRVCMERKYCPFYHFWEEVKVFYVGVSSANSLSCESQAKMMSLSRSSWGT